MKYQLTILCLLLTFSLQASVIYVNTSALGNNDGTSWENAYIDLQDAISAALAGDELWIAQGSYYPTNGIDRHLYFELKNGVKWYGGFNGTEVNLSDRDPINYISLLSGDIGIQNDSFDNSFTVVYTVNTDSTTVLDGLTIDHGNASSGNINDPTDSPPRSGGGLYVLADGNGSEARPEIRHCTFSNNVAFSYGGAICCNSNGEGSVTPLINECIFTNNRTFTTVGGSGGAISKPGGNLGKHSILNSTFINNSTGFGRGGAIYIYDVTGQSLLVIDSCSFDGNSAGRGGAIEIEDANDLGKVKIMNSSFSNSRVVAEGVAIYVFSQDNTSDFEISGCDFTENRDSLGRGIVFCVKATFDNEPKEIIISNSTFKRNLSKVEGTILFDGLLKPCFLKLLGCSFIENEVIGSAGRTIAVKPFGSKCNVKNSLFYNNRNGNEGEIFRMATIAPDSIGIENDLVVENSILWNNNNAVNEKYVDGFGNFLFQNCLIDVFDCQDLVEDDTLVSLTCFNMLYNQYPEFLDTTNCDLRLKPCSPAVNAGDNSLLDSTMVFDLLGNARIDEALVDLGPYETVFPLSVASIDSVNCHGESTGAVYFEFKNGEIPLSYEWTNTQGAGITNTNLESGNYSFTVTDATGCSRTIDVEINEASGLEIESSVMNASSSTQADGQIQLITVTGGNLPYTYSWSSGGDSASVDNLLPGTYDLTITDGNDCEYFFTFDVGFANAVSIVNGLENIWSFPTIAKPGADFSIHIDSPDHATVELLMFTTGGEQIHQESFYKVERELVRNLKAPSQNGLYFITVYINGAQRKMLYLLVNQ